ncbi:hypothetical protein TWF694_004743 [Orbilia ellipsospora]|uniref:Indole-3-glycerol-phosphate synthase n=1 Tax=Orbilia ellipsospora TaxID=2528407 RepID=A0AAV9WYL5_9PEZI
MFSQNLMLSLCFIKVAVTAAIWKEKAKGAGCAVVLLELASSTLTDWTLMMAALAVLRSDTIRVHGANNESIESYTSQMTGSTSSDMSSRNSRISTTSTTKSSLIRRTIISEPMKAFLRMRGRRMEAESGRVAGMELLDSETRFRLGGISSVGAEGGIADWAPEPDNIRS